MNHFMWFDSKCMAKNIRRKCQKAHPVPCGQEEAWVLSCRWKEAQDGSMQEVAWSFVEGACCLSMPHASCTELGSPGIFYGSCNCHGTNDSQGSVRELQLSDVNKLLS
jgi:hypothetical protein